MLQEPDVPEETIASCLRAEYGLTVTAIAFLALGADADTAVYRIAADHDSVYFLKLRRRGAFAASTVEIPYLLHQQGIAPVIAPVATTNGQLWTLVERFAVVLYPFIEGRDAFDSPLSDRQWTEFGVAVKRIHTAVLPTVLSRRIPREAYSSRWRDRVRELQRWAAQGGVSDPVAAPLVDYLHVHETTITDLVGRAERLAAAVYEQQPDCVLCHADLHAFNLLIGDAGTLYIVDWDTTILAPRERDLMFIGGGVGGIWNDDREVDLFYTGYGMAELDVTALAYYRYERIVEDIAVCSDEFLGNTAGEATRAEALAMIRSQFARNGVVDVAYRSNPRGMAPPG